MVHSSLFVLSALTLRAAALLVLPEVDDEAVVPGGIHHFDAHDPNTQVVNLKCDECPFAAEADDGTLSWSDSTSTYLVWMSLIRVVDIDDRYANVLSRL